MGHSCGKCWQCSCLQGLPWRMSGWLWLDPAADSTEGPFPQPRIDKWGRLKWFTADKSGSEWWKSDRIMLDNRITPVREEERSPMSLSYSALQSTIQQYYLLYNKRAFYTNMMWSSFTWKISSVFSKILLVSQRENGDYTSKPWASMPTAGAFVQQEPPLIICLITATRTITFLLSEWLWARWAASCKTQTFISLALHPPNYL